MNSTVIDRRSFCGYLKKIYVKGGDNALNRYTKYLTKERSKKRLSLDRINELEDMKNTLEWWITNVKKHINVDTIKRRQLERQNIKDRKLVSWLAGQVVTGAMTVESIRNEIIRDDVNKLISEMPF